MFTGVHSRTYDLLDLLYELIHDFEILGMTGAEVIAFIEKGHRLLRPPQADVDVYSTMNWCWEIEPKNRATFKQLFEFFAETPEYTNLKELLFVQDFEGLMPKK